MLRKRVIPCLLLSGKRLVKTKQFKNAAYIGDPINAIKIFNDKEVDELLLLDIDATVKKTEPNFKLIEEIAGECFMPLAYGGGIQSLKDIERLNKIGVEKVVISSRAVYNRPFLQEAIKEFGSSTIVVCLDVKKNFWGNYEIYTHSGSKRTGIGPVSFSAELKELGVGEIIVNSIDRDGTYKGYDIALLSRIVKNVDMPVVACGGAGSLQHFTEAVKLAGVSAVSAGSIFVFYGSNRAVLINYPSSDELEVLFR
jgi:imidazole glycerol-phosphate synthase subunit HisF